VRERDDEIAWRRIAGLRDVLAHAYFGVDETSSGTSCRSRSRRCCLC
jgi:uncharacterized protein with HEPN domain